MSRRLTFALILAVAVAAPRAHAQLEEVIVTATKTGETRLQDTPIAVTAIEGDTVVRSGIANIRDIVSLTPNLAVAENSGFSIISIRGIGSSNVFAGSDPSTTIHMDGVYLARPFAQFFNFLDVERVEVLRGPQGTLYGRNSVGGTINVVSRAPTDQLQGTARATIGTDNLLQPEFAISGPLVAGKLRASLSATHRQHDGHVENIVPGVPDLGDDNSSSARVQLQWLATERLEATTRADYFDASTRPNSFSKTLQPFSPLTNSVLGDYGKIAHNYASRSEVRLWGLAEDIRFEIAKDLVVRSLTAYRESRIDADIDSDATELDLLRSHPAEDQSQWSQELTLSGGTTRFEYVAGGFYFEEEIAESVVVENIGAGINISFLPKVRTSSWAAFAQATFHLNTKLALNAGARYTNEDKEIDQNSGIFLRANGAPLPIPLNPSAYSASDTYSATTPRFGLEYRPTDRHLLYATASRGFKSGGFDNTARNSDQGFKSEDLWSYELGTKSSFFDRRLTMNLSAFRYDYKDLQVQVAIAPGVSSLTNAASVTTDGIELEMNAQPVDSLRLGLMASYLDAVYDSYPNAVLLGQVFDASGRRLGAPRTSVGVFAEHLWRMRGGGSLSLRADGFWRGRSYSIHDAVPYQASYDLFNASLSYQSADERWGLTLWGRNLFDEEYVTSITTFTATFAGRPGEPQRAGLMFTYRL